MVRTRIRGREGGREEGREGGREGSPCRDDEDVIVGHFVGAINTLREDEAISLPVPEGGGEEGSEDGKERA